MRKLVWILPVLVLAAAASACGTAKSGATAGSSAPGSNPCAVKNLALLHPGTLTIGTDNPAYSPYFTGGPGHSWTGQFNNDPYTGKGFEDAVAYAVAKQMGFSKSQVKWQVTHFNQSYAPGPKPFDFYLAQVSITPQRAKEVDFSTPYWDVNQAVVALKSDPISHATSIADLKQYKLGTQVGTTSYDFIQNTIQPTSQPMAYPTLNNAISGLKAHQIDGIVIDLPTAFYMTAVQIPDSTIVGQFAAGSTPNHVGLVLQKGSALTPCVDKALAVLRGNGTLAQIQQKWLSQKASAPVLH
jgi:polar amino acid transport system substrate-binding protein